ncbi:MAG: class I SAM-dependent methyltransferase [Candidatus Omnitrophica bacterium]|nr:class I SAM-dependent methyltransferase [Candidatus Omnitrophota bacterium]
MIPCRICRSSDSTKLFTKDNIDIVRCRACGLEYADAMPGPQQLKDLYDEKYFRSGGSGTSYFDYLAEEEAMALNAARRLARIEEIKPARGKLLDVGCATGVFLKAASGKWDAAGVELSGFASSYAREKRGLAVKTGTLKEAAYPDKHFDVITMWDVIEHLPDPGQDLAAAGRMLKDDGLLVLTTGDAGSLFARMCGRHWHLYNPAQHLSFFSKKTISLLLEKSGFKVLKIGKEGACFTAGYLASHLAMYYPSRVFKSMHDMVNRSRLKDIKVSVNLRDIITIYATIS